MSKESVLEKEAGGSAYRPGKRSWYKDGLLLTIFLVTLGLDQLSKYLIQTNFYFGQSLPREGFFRLTYTTNTGSAFGLFPNQTLLLVLASFLGIAFLILFYRSHPVPGSFLRLSLGLQLGGAIGNLIDRVRLGRVVDFIDVGVWPVFNIADSAIVVGIGILIWIVLFSKQGRNVREAGDEAVRADSEEELPS